jgi:hypothetical protein
MGTMVEIGMPSVVEADDVSPGSRVQEILVADSELAVGGMCMVDCKSPNGCVSPGGRDDEFSCVAQNRCSMA